MWARCMAVVVTWTLNRRAPLRFRAKKCRPSATPLKLAEFDSSGADSVQFLFGVAVGNFAAALRPLRPPVDLRRSAAWHLARCGWRFGIGYLQRTAYLQLRKRFHPPRLHTFMDIAELQYEPIKVLVTPHIHAF